MSLKIFLAMLAHLTKITHLTGGGPADPEPDGPEPDGPEPDGPDDDMVYRY